MDRRSFLTRLFTGAASVVAVSKLEVLESLAAAGVEDPEKVLWIPEEKTIFIPDIIAPPDVMEQLTTPMDVLLLPGRRVRSARSVRVTHDTGLVEVFDSLDPSAKPVQVYKPTPKQVQFMSDAEKYSIYKGCR